jgi:BirA family biotin operon repressor/biotin-[acetyl-CoA-carboxylase] ligase
LPTFNTLFVGKVVVSFRELSSTNERAIELLAKTKPSEGTAITAEFQTAGRGQIGSSWHSTPGANLLLSVILYPHWLTARRGFLLSMAAGLAVADTVLELGASEVKVKWPNDVYVGQEKVAGILLQNSLAGQKIQWSVVGIGLNVNETDFPPALPNPTSLRRHLGRDIPLEEVRTLLFARLEQRYRQAQLRTAELEAAYLQHLYRYQETDTFRRTTTGEDFSGRIVRVSPEGRLIVAHQHGSEEAFDLKAIQFAS